LAPVIAVKVSNEARFRRWFWPQCLSYWLFPTTTQRPAGSDGLSPYYGYFLTVTGASARWLSSEAVIPQSTAAQLSARAAKQEQRLEKRYGSCRELPSTPR
jgi:hypothetical protein